MRILQSEIETKLISHSTGYDLGYPQSLEIGLYSALQISHPSTNHCILRLKVCDRFNCQCASTNLHLRLGSMAFVLTATIFDSKHLESRVAKIGL